MFNFRSSETESSGGAMRWVRLAFRILQFVMAITVAGLYGVDLSRAKAQGKYMDSKWVYTEVVAGLSAATALVFCIPLVKAWFFFIWDFILFILWIAVFGIFGKMYIKEDPEGDSEIMRMKNAVWIDLVNMLLWFVTAIIGLLTFLKHKSMRTLHTGRATV